MRIKITKLFPEYKMYSYREDELVYDKISERDGRLYILTLGLPNKGWPQEVEFRGQTYIFKCNEVMPNWAISHYLGYAAYSLKEIV